MASTGPMTLRRLVLTRNIGLSSYQISHQPRLYKRYVATDVSPGAGRMSDLSGLGPKRFYERVDVETSADKDNTRPKKYIVTVDGKPVKTPKRHILSTPSKAFSIAVAAEWDAQKGRIRPSSMPLTGLACAALDVIPEFGLKMQSSILRFIDTDTACIRPDTPRELVSAQNDSLDPVIEHVKKQSGCEVNVVRGTLAAPQGEGLNKWMKKVVEGLDDWSLVAMDSATSSSKSVLVAVALRDGAVSAEDALKAARSEEMWQSKVWGVVEGGHDMDDADISVRLSAVNMVFRFVDLDRLSFEKASGDLKVKRKKMDTT